MTNNFDCFQGIEPDTAMLGDPEMVNIKLDGHIEQPFAPYSHETVMKFGEMIFKERQLKFCVYCEARPDEKNARLNVLLVSHTRAISIAPHAALELADTLPDSAEKQATSLREMAERAISFVNDLVK